MAQELKDTSLYADAVSYWRMEDVNDSKGSNNLTNNGTATFIAGKFTNGVNLVATSNQYLSIADASQTGLDLTGDFSFSFWVKFTSLPANGAEFTLICKDNTSTQRNFNTSIYNNAGTYRWYLDTFGNVGTESVYWNFNPTVGVWYLINFTYDVSEATATSGGFYINGISQGASTTVATNNNTSLNNCTADFIIGARSSSNLNGMFDDVGVFTKVLTLSEIQNLYDRGIKKINGVYMGSQEIASTRFAGDAVGYWRMEGNSLDETANNNDGTDTSMSYVVGKYGQAASFSGSSHITIGTGLNTVLTSNAWTISFWMKPTANNVLQMLLANDKDTGTRQFFLALETNGMIAFRNIAYGAEQQSLTSVVPTTSYSFITVTYDGTNAIFYCNAVKGTTYAMTALASSGNNLTFGYREYSGAESPYTGLLDDIAILNRALTSDEIYSLYKTGVKKLNGVVNLNPELESSSLRGDANLVQYTRFEGNSTATVGNNGTDTAITYGTTYGKHGQGASFNGTSSKIVLADTNFPLGNGDRTICAWIKLDAIGAERTILDYGTRANYQDVAFDVLSTGKLWMDIYNEGKGGDKVLAAGVWNHVAVSYIGSTKTASFYINGVLDRAQTYTNALNTTLSTARIGCLQTDAHYFFNGSIDEVSVFSRALTATEISNLYNTNIKKYMGMANT